MLGLLSWRHQDMWPHLSSHKWLPLYEQQQQCCVYSQLAAETHSINALTDKKFPPVNGMDRTKSLSSHPHNMMRYHPSQCMYTTVLSSCSDKSKTTYTIHLLHLLLKHTVLTCYHVLLRWVVLDVVSVYRLHTLFPPLAAQ